MGIPRHRPEFHDFEPFWGKGGFPPLLIKGSKIVKIGPFCMETVALPAEKRNARVLRSFKREEQILKMVPGGGFSGFWAFLWDLLTFWGCFWGFLGVFLGGFWGFGDS